MRAVRVGVIGVGRFGQLHVQVLEKHLNCQVVAIADINQGTLSKVAEQHNIPKTYTDPMDVINHPEIDVVDIVSDEDSHGELVIESLLAGKHVFVEKPLATKTAQAERIHKLALEKNKILDPCKKIVVE